MKKALLILAAALMCVCACKNQERSSDKSGSAVKASSSFNVDGAYYVKYLIGGKDIWILAVKDKQMRFDMLCAGIDYDEVGNEKTVYTHYCYLVNTDGQFMYEGEEWKDDDFTPRNTIFNTLSCLKIDPKKYYDAGFVKTGSVEVLGHKLDVYSGDGHMQSTWAGYESIIGHRGDYKETFATYGGILFYLTEDDDVACQAVSVSTKVPDAAFQKSLDVDWAK